MLIKAGVDISRLRRPIRRKLPVIAAIVMTIEGTDLVITSTYEGTHRDDSLHYCDEAIDIRKGKKAQAVQNEIKRQLGPDFDVVIFTYGIHIEYDPK